MNEINLDEMRQQIAILKEKIEKQEVVTDRMLRSTMKKKIMVIHLQELKAILTGLFGIALYVGLKVIGYFEFSWALVGVTCAALVCSVGFTIYFHRPMHDSNLMNADVASVAVVMRRFRRQYCFWLHYVAPTFLLPWLAWMCYEYVAINSEAHIKPLYLILPLLIGAVIGGLVGYTWHRKAVGSADDILQQIEEW